MKIKVLSLSLLAFLVFVSTTYAAGGLVPCDGPDCNLGSLATGVNNLLKFIINITVTGAALLFAWAGFQYMTAQGDEGKIKQAHSIFWKVFVGLIIVLAAWLVVSTILKVLTGEDLNQRQEDLLQN